jgi:hypothetical protein
MRVRAQDAYGDMTFGRGVQNFLINTPAAVAQLVLTRLLLLQGEWFLNVFAGMPWGTQVFGKNSEKTYDAAIKQCILNTQGVRQITKYQSALSGRSLTISATLDTDYGEAFLPQTVFGLPISIPVLP